MRYSCHERSIFHALRVTCLFVVAFASALSGLKGVAPAQGQANVISSEDVTTPTPMPVLLPTPTPASSGRNPADVPNSGEALRAATSTGYIVQEGDTVWTVALEIGLDLDAMPCLIDPFHRQDKPLVIGERLEPPAGEMICRLVQSGDTVSSIAALYAVDASQIVSDPWNALDSDVEGHGLLEPGRYVRIVIEPPAPTSQAFLAYLLERPIDEPPMVAYAIGGPTRGSDETLVPADWKYGSGYFEWPTYGWITQAYRNDHRAVDIAAPPGAFVTAADRGVVVRAGWNRQGYGMFVVIDHNIDYVTLYSHLQDILVTEGDIVAQGQVIGTVGSTGNSTGPHLHFEVRDFGSRINPLEVLLR